MEYGFQKSTRALLPDSVGVAYDMRHDPSLRGMFLLRPRDDGKILVGSVMRVQETAGVLLLNGVEPAIENPGWGYTRLQGALRNLGHRVARTTIAKSLKNAGLPPTPDRPTSWRVFLQAHWPALRGADFFTTDVDVAWARHVLHPRCD